VYQFHCCGLGSFDQCVERVVVLGDDDELDSANANAALSDSNANGASQGVDSRPSPTMLPSLGDDLSGADSLEGDNIEERLRSALVD
jgi:hypothetical protein